MSTIKVGDNESVESALRRFKRKCSRDGIIGDLRKKEFYESPSVKRRKKAEAARKRNMPTMQNSHLHFVISRLLSFARSIAFI